MNSRLSARAGTVDQAAARNGRRCVSAVTHLAAAVVLLNIAGCIGTTVEEPPEFRKLEPAPQTSETKPENPALAGLEQPSDAPKEAPAATQPGPSPSLTPALPAGPQKARVAILLPLSGPSGTLGKALLDAAQLSLFELADDSFILMPFDTAGTAAGAEQAADAAVAAGAQLILGPLHAVAVRAAAPRARAAGVSIVAFSNSREVGGDGVYVFGFLPRQQVEAVVGYAFSTGLTRLAVLAPNDDYGRTVVDAARAAVDAGGGFLVRTMYYAPDAADLSGEVKAFANYNTRRQALAAQRKALQDKGDEASLNALRRLERLDTIGELPYDAVLLPESGERLRTLSSLLAYYDVDQPAVRFLGLRSWDLIPNLGAEPALIGAWFAGSPAEERVRFGERFKRAFGHLPPRLATLAYDATALAVVLARGEDGPDFSSAAMTDRNGFLGIDGIFRLHPDGVVERVFTIHEVQRDGVTVRRSAPQSFTQTIN